MITALGEMSLAAAMPATAQATATVGALASTTVPSAAAAVSALAGTSVPAAVGAITSLAAMNSPDLTAKAAGYGLAMVPSPSLDINAQLALAMTNLSTLLATLSADPAGAALAATLTAAIAAQNAALLAVTGYNSSIGGDIETCLSSIAGIKVALASGVSGPNVNISIIASTLAQVQAQLTALAAQAAMAATLEAAAEAQMAVAASCTAAANAAASLVAAINTSLNVGGLRMYRFDGDIAAAGTELAQLVADEALSGELHFVLMLPTNGVAWGALQSTIRTA